MMVPRLRLQLLSPWLFFAGFFYFFLLRIEYVRMNVLHIFLRMSKVSRFTF